MYYFASDLHLGQSAGSDPRERERLFVQWLDAVSPQARGIYLVGDIFDFWFEYRRVVPRGHTRLLGKLSELTDRGVAIHLFVGNHDLWTFDYLHTECGVTIHRQAYEVVELAGQRLLIGHGDLLGPRPAVQRLLSGLFRCRTVQRLFGLLHPWWGVGLAQGWSGQSRKAKPIGHRFRGETEPVVQFARHYLAHDPTIDWFICGHIHCATIHRLTPRSSLVFLGEWMLRPTYGVLTEAGFTLLTYPEQTPLETLPQ